MAGLEVLVAVILGVTLYGVAAALCERSGPRQVLAPGTDVGPRPGYAFYPAAALQRRRLGLDRALWRVWSLETFHKPGRRRAVLTVSLRAAAAKLSALEIVQALERSTHQLLLTSGLEAIVVEVCQRPSGPSAVGDWVALRTCDGRGWGGRQRGVFFLVESPQAVRSPRGSAASIEDRDA